MHTTVKRASVSLGAALLLAFAAACGSDSGGGDGGSGNGGGDGGGNGGSGTIRGAQAALKAIDEKTSGAESSKFESTMVMGEAMTTENEGELDWADGAIGTATVKYTDGQMASSIQMMDDDGTLDARYLPDAYYAGVEGAFQTQYPDKKWIRYDYDDLSEFMGPSGDYMKDQMQNSTPGQAVKLLLASEDVEEVGEEEVRGVQTTHYSGTVDVSDLARASSKTLSEQQLSDLEDQLEASGVTTQTVDIWVDENDLMIKREESGKMTGGEFSTTVYYSDYGVDVNVEEPSAAESIDFTEIQ
ncbi:lipoprotein [Streptomyces sp. CNQ-509]|uniref:hypothetical protein n=1 Tax=unclassified Streptomyces TaxID=2593676 RepID=UPI00062DFD76|nr:hypothetical protein [Streptomyces sp. CNQ-509]AKH86935.1 lipoprotein [Streptomyces sp. CNQ-509]